MSEQRTPNILQDRKYSLLAKKFDGGKGQPKAFFSVYKGNVSLMVYTNNPNDADTKPIRIGLSGPLFGLLVDMIKSVRDHEGPCQEQFVAMTGKPNELKVSGKIIIGKGEDGVVFIAPKVDGKTAVKFNIMPDMYVELLKKDGTPYTPGERSKLYCGAWLDIVNTIVTAQIQQTYEPPENPYQKKQGGGNGGGWNKPQQSGPSTDFDDFPI